jgi:UDP-hydrolysing UDP-N-acetyl-D-glucosamine 2-epimerase
MVSMVKIAVITSTRADYGLLEGIIKCLHEDSEVELQLFVTGTHLSEKHGMTVDDIKYPILSKVKIGAHYLGDNCRDVSLMAAFALLFFSDMRFELSNPDALIVLGDRSEILSTCITAHIRRIPIIHFYGGEETLGAYDNAFRHCITKLASLHFVSHRICREKVIGMGEHPDTVYVSGPLGLDGLKKRVWKKKGRILVLYHPETLKGEKERNAETDKIFDTLKNRKEEILFISPNADSGNQYIRDKIKKSGHECVENLKRCEFLELLGNVDMLVGNSSAGYYETPLLGIPTITIGNRQKGRFATHNMILSDGEFLNSSIDHIYNNKKFQNIINSDYPIHYKPNLKPDQIVKIIKKEIPHINLEKEIYA